MKYEDIKKANETILTTDIKGKDYAEVNQRIKAFRMCYPTGTIETEMVSNEGGVCIFRACVYAKKILIGEADYGSFENAPIYADVLLGTGTAYEKEGSTFINKTSYIENCETSAVGRALAMCGFGIDTSIASKEEVENAIEQQEQEKKDLKERNDLLVNIKKLMYKKNTLPEDVNAKFLKSSTDMNNEELKEVAEWLETLEDYDYKKVK